MTNNKLICLHCAKEKAVSGFYSHRNPLINEKFGFCKICVKSYVKESKLETLYDFLRTMDIPYLKEYWTKAHEGITETIGTYLKNLNSLKQNKDLRYSDSDDMGIKVSQVESVVQDLDMEITPTIISRWGRNFALDDYVALETIYENYGGHMTEDTIQQGLIINISKTQWSANTALENGDHTRYEKMMNVLSKLMGDANIKPVQIKAQAQAEGGKMSSWGEWVMLVEEKEPVDETDKSFKDEAFIRKYINTFFFTQIKRIFGRATDEDIEKLNKTVDGKLE